MRSSIRLILMITLSLGGCALYNYGSEVVYHGNHRYTVISSGNYKFATLQAARDKSEKVCFEQKPRLVPEYYNIKTTTDRISQETLDQIFSVRAYKKSTDYNRYEQSRDAREETKLEGTYKIIVDFKCVSLKKKREGYEL